MRSSLGFYILSAVSFSTLLAVVYLYVESILAKIKKGKPIKVLYGWPPYHQYYYIVYFYPKCGHWEIVKDDLFADLRPKEISLGCNATNIGELASQELYNTALEIFMR